MSASTLQQLREAFELRPQRAKDETWLPRGFAGILAILDDYRANDATLWASALLLVVMERGGTCLPLDSIPILDEAERLPAEFRSFTGDQWRDALVGDAFGDGDAVARPLVLEGDRLYFDRYFRLERDVAQRLVLPLGPGALGEPVGWAGVVDATFGEDERNQLQREVALNLFRSRVTVLAGGPGTGKTFTVAKLLVALHQSTSGAATVKLCAPTGKAAQRIGESLADVVRLVDAERADLIMAGVQPTTIHKLLNISPLAARRRRSDFLHVDFVICDETSMVDLALLDELLRAVSEDTRIVLVGDPNQLQSVDVGTVMTDLVAATAHGLQGTVLEEVFRVMANPSLDQGQRDFMLQFFADIRHDRVDEALAALSEGGGVLHHVPVTVDGGWGASGDDIVQQVLDRATQLVALSSSPPDAVAMTTALTSTMVLSAQHRGPLSRTWWCEKVGNHLGFREGAAPTFAGLPVLVTANDRANGLTNGDTGLIIRDDDHNLVYQPATRVSSRVSDDGSAATLPATAVHEWQPWWAMTIHKSQGSEFDTVIVSITPKTRLLSKELLYTAVTRAKKRVIIVGRMDDVEMALRSPAKRFSGLTELISCEAARIESHQ